MKTQFKIEKGIPLPPPSPGRQRKYPYADLEVGESFFVPDKRVLYSLSGITSRFGEKCGRKFATRLMDGGVRVWRVE